MLLLKASWHSNSGQFLVKMGFFLIFAYKNLYNFAHFEPSNCTNISLQWNFGRQNIFLSIFQLYKCFYNTWSLWDFFGQLILSKVWQKTHLVTRGWNKTRQWEIDIWVRGSFTPFVLEISFFLLSKFHAGAFQTKKNIFSCKATT